MKNKTIIKGCLILSLTLTGTIAFAYYDIHTGELSGDYSGENHIDSVWENTYVKDGEKVIFSTSTNKTDYTRANFTGANLTSASFRNATLKDAKFTNATIKGADFYETVIFAGAVSVGFTEAQLKSTKSYQEKDLSGINLGHNYLGGWNFSGQNLTSAYFGWANLKNTDFTNATINGASFNGVNNFTEAQLKSTKSYQEKNLSGINLGYSLDLSGWDFNGQNLTSAYFYSSTLANADFTNANLTSARFDNTTLTNADFANATVKNTSFPDGKGFTETQLKSTKSYQEKDLSGINLFHHDLSGWNFSGQNLTSSIFQKSTLTNTDFSNANLTSVNFITAILTDTNFTNANLTSAIFDSATLTDMDFSNMTIKDGNFWGATLENVNFTNADLTSTNFNKATFTNVDFTNANLTSTNFYNATLTNVDFTNATIKGGTFGRINGFTETQLKSTKSYQEKDLSGILLSGNDLSGWDFSGQNLQNSRFRYATLSDVNFKQADLRGSDLTGITGSLKTQNTIWTDGEIKNFSMESVDDSLTIRAYVPATSGGAMINAKIVDDASISGGAVLTLEQGAVLEIASGKTLSVLDNSEIIFNVDAAASDATKILLGENSKLVFGSDSKIIVNLDGVISPDDSYALSVIEVAADACISVADAISKDNLVLNVNGEAYDSDKWGFNFDPTTGALTINVNVPEPTTVAAIFGALALAFAAYRRRR